MILFEKSLKEVNFKDVDDLVKNEVPETYNLDYKQKYSDNKKLAKLMIAFANATVDILLLE